VTCPGCGFCGDPECCSPCDCAEHWEEIVLAAKEQAVKARADARTAVEAAEQRVREADARARAAEVRVRRMAEAWRLLSDEAEKIRHESLNREL
jgi:hypothetical protein